MSQFNGSSHVSAIGRGDAVRAISNAPRGPAMNEAAAIEV
jgi:hypothetical protein